jgi:hypothetical protein
VVKHLRAQVGPGYATGAPMCGASGGTVVKGRRGVTCPWCRKAGKLPRPRTKRQQLLMPWAAPPREYAREAEGLFAPLHVSMYSADGTLVQVVELAPAHATEVWRLRRRYMTPEYKAFRVPGCFGCELYGLCAAHGPVWVDPDAVADNAVSNSGTNNDTKELSQ